MNDFDLSRLKKALREIHYDVVVRLDELSMSAIKPAMITLPVMKTKDYKIKIVIEFGGGEI